MFLATGYTSGRDNSCGETTMRAITPLRGLSSFSSKLAVGQISKRGAAMWRIAAVITSVVLFATLSLPLRAQEIVGNIVGNVQDTSGGVIVGASVLAHNET